MLSAPGATSTWGLERWNWEPLPKVVALSGRCSWNTSEMSAVNTEHRWSKQSLQNMARRNKRLTVSLFPSLSASYDHHSPRDVRKARLYPQHLLWSGHSHDKWTLLHLLCLRFRLTLELALLWGWPPEIPSRLSYYVIITPATHI